MATLSTDESTGKWVTELNEPTCTPTALAGGWGAKAKDIGGPPLALLLLIALSPVFLLIALAIKWTSPGPILHRRRVLGRGGQPFDAFKFRTMVVDADAILSGDADLQKAFSVSYKLKHDPRITSVGGLLRRYSLDELPQLLNVVRGQMWLIGPRMISPEELAKYGAKGPRLLAVKPGITGLWQVSGRQTTTYARRVELDMEYLDRWTPMLDLSILALTIKAVISGRGAY